MSIKKPKRKKELKKLGKRFLKKINKSIMNKKSCHIQMELILYH